VSFSVVVTNWNRADVLPISLKSILVQKGVKNLEILIIDDASDDESLEVAKEFRRKHPDIIRVFETHESLTHNICLPANIGFKRAKYEYVVLNPSDTIQVLDTNFLEYAKVLSNNPKAWADPKLLYLSTWKGKKQGLAQAGGCTRREWLHKITGYDERMHGHGANEPDLFFRLRLIGVVPVKCNAFVIHFDKKLVNKIPRRNHDPRNNEIHRENAEKQTIAPNKKWGEHPRLEEIL